MRREFVLLLLLLALVCFHMGQTRAATNPSQEAEASHTVCVVPQEWGAYRGEWAVGSRNGPAFEARDGTLRFVDGRLCAGIDPSGQIGQLPGSTKVVFEIRRR